MLDWNTTSRLSTGAPPRQGPLNPLLKAPCQRRFQGFRNETNKHLRGNTDRKGNLENASSLPLQNP